MKKFSIRVCVAVISLTFLPTAATAQKVIENSGLSIKSAKDRDDVGTGNGNTGPGSGGNKASGEKAVILKETAPARSPADVGQGSGNTAGGSGGSTGGSGSKGGTAGPKPSK
jgi:hypothetical protein